ncbi:DUF2306 domain-containing protein [Brevundimonas sp. Root1279]|uniref:DUF2306 domain-containing protein n=1 Tax=Brevundimonas sp. Root1279 TaxID=1736443 RepID=UPI0006F4D7E7|nr:DUF2306 domain-containing protein [Brevundimonas sp. Root1279]KQW86362.1 hypothetical protein ASC65_00160 [Brevundimonas sp. Root1279]
MKRAAATMVFGLMALMCLGVALFSARYLLPTPIMVEGMRFHLDARPLVFLTHVAGGVTALALGIFQPVTRRGPRRVWHRWAGRVYVLACLVGAVAGLGLALTSTAGPMAHWGFGLLAIAWFTTTVLGWRKAVAGEFGQHRRWMIRSLSLTFAAVTLRIMLPLIPLTGLDFVEGYRWVAFLCWVPNLLVAELWIRLSGWPEASPMALQTSPRSR